MNKKLFNGDGIIIYTDGGARGNPGEAAVGVVMGVKKYKERIGVATNNVAGYKAVVLALKKAKQLLGKEAAVKAEIEIRMDSELVQRQLAGKYRIKEDELKILYCDIHNLLFNFGKVSFRHVRREENKEADRLVNEALDGK